MHTQRRRGNPGDRCWCKDYRSQQSEDEDQFEISLLLARHFDLQCLGCGHSLCTTQRAAGFSIFCQDLHCVKRSEAGLGQSNWSLGANTGALLSGRPW